MASFVVDGDGIGKVCNGDSGCISDAGGFGNDARDGGVVEQPEAAPKAARINRNENLADSFDCITLLPYGANPVNVDRLDFGAHDDLFLFQLGDFDDAARYGGSGFNQQERVVTQLAPCQGYPCHIRLDLPPLGALFFELAD